MRFEIQRKSILTKTHIKGETTLTLDLTENTIDETVVSVENPPDDLNVEHPQENIENKESALEHLAKNLETTGKYRELTEEAKPNDIIAFKVFMPDFQKSDYVIGLVESVNKRDKPNDYDIIFTIMAGSVHIQHLRDDDDEEQNIQIGINRMDMFDAKLLEL